MLPTPSLHKAYCIEYHVDKMEAEETDCHYVYSSIEFQTAFISVF